MSHELRDNGTIRDGDMRKFRLSSSRPNYEIHEHNVSSALCRQGQGTKQRVVCRMAPFRANESPRAAPRAGDGTPRNRPNHSRRRNCSTTSFGDPFS
ncbi:Protein of unknown function, partial [Gryllus bimaculatus]